MQEYFLEDMLDVLEWVAQALPQVNLLLHFQTLINISQGVRLDYCTTVQVHGMQSRECQVSHGCESCSSSDSYL